MSIHTPIMTRPYGVSILSAAQLVGLVPFVFSRRGVNEAFGEADTLGFGVQMLPLATWPCSDSKFESMLQSARMSGVDIISYEDRWGGTNPLHPITHDLRDGQLKAVLAYYLLFPWLYAGVQRRIDLLRQYYPDAIAVDLPGGPVEIDPHKGSLTDWYVWLRTPEAKACGVVLDTHHLMGFDEAGSAGALKHALHILQIVKDEGVPVRLIHVQFRHRVALEEFCFFSGCPTTEQLLSEMKWMPQIGSATPVIIELTPELTTADTLQQIRGRVEEILV